ncbi:MAG: PQQ-binding-like beta-propeller repeat protein [Spirochaetaceae bacterium]|jgi:outer membrane protein assembly factor BamB|nr:PQQ-binding-like beta-propeller repeat protein [Spirochaetaceae bacterium]
MYKRLIIMVMCLVLSAGAFRIGAETASGVFPRESGGAAAPIWRQAPGGKLLGVPSVQAGTVVAVMDGGHLKAYSLDGKPLWDYYAKSKLIPYVSRNRDGTSFICRTDGFLIAVNNGGRELWRLKTGPITAPVVNGWDGRIFVTTEEKIYCYTASGYLLWTRELAGDVVSGPFLGGGGGIVAALKNGELLELGPFGAAQSRPIGETPQAIIPIDGGTLALLKRGGVRLFYSDSSSPDQPFISIRGSPIGGVSRGDSVAMLLSNGSVTQISLSEKKVKWSESSHIKNNEVKTIDDYSMIWDERGIYVFSHRGATGFSIEGKRLWTITLKGTSAIPALGDNGTLLSGGQDWILYAYKVENRTLPQSSSAAVPAEKYGLGGILPGMETFYSLVEYMVNEELTKLGVMIRDGQIGENEPFYTMYLREIAFSSITPRTSTNRLRVNFRLRAEAARLLGYFASREAIPFLAELFLKDDDPLVRIAAAESIGRIGTDPEGIALKAFARTINAVRREERVLSAIVSATGSLCRFSGPPLSETGIKLLQDMEQDSMPYRVRDQAREEIAKILL